MAQRSAHLLFGMLSIMAVSALAATGVDDWEPIKDLSNPMVIKIAKFAVAEHNKKDGAHLVFSRVLKGEKQIVSGANYRLGISTNDGDLLNSYTAVVYAPSGNKPLQLISFVEHLQN